MKQGAFVTGILAVRDLSKPGSEEKTVRALYRTETHTLVALQVESEFPGQGMHFFEAQGREYLVAAAFIHAAHDDAAGDASVYGLERTDTIPEWAQGRLQLEYVDHVIGDHVFAIEPALTAYKPAYGEPASGADMDACFDFVKQAARTDFKDALLGRGVFQQYMDKLTGHPREVASKAPVRIYHAVDLMGAIATGCNGLLPGSQVTTVPELANDRALHIAEAGGVAVVLSMDVTESPSFWCADDQAIASPVSEVLATCIEGFNGSKLQEAWERSDRTGLASLALAGSAITARLVPSTSIFVELDGERVELLDCLASQGVHICDDSGMAYGASQCMDEVETGHCLIGVDDQVVGIADTWPVAITEQHGELHTPESGQNPFIERAITAEQIEFAASVAERLKFPVADWVAGLSVSPHKPKSIGPR